MLLANKYFKNDKNQLKLFLGPHQLKLIGGGNAFEWCNTQWGFKRQEITI